MAAKITDIYDFIDSFAPFDTAMDFDNVGLLVEGESEAVTKVLLALDITGDVAEEAKAIGAQLIISHHPVIFNPLKALKRDSVPYALAKSGIGALCVHTNLDICEFGTNTAMFKAIGLLDREPLGIDGGLIGTLEEPLSSKELAQHVKNVFGCDSVRYTENGRKITRVALVAGAGGEGIFAAKAMGAEAFVTGEIKHHEIIFAHENDMCIIDTGHRKCEEAVLPALLKLLEERFADVSFKLSQSYTDGISYI